MVQAFCRQNSPAMHRRGRDTPVPTDRCRLGSEPTQKGRSKLKHSFRQRSQPRRDLRHKYLLKLTSCHNMSSSTKWREEQVLVICPGSSTTMAQLGCSELTPPSQRFPTRMFKDEETGDWRPYYTYKRQKKSMAALNGAGAQNGEGAAKKDEEEWEYIEDPDSDEGAAYPMQGRP